MGNSAEYMKQYQEKHREKLKKYNHDYNIMNNAEILQRKKEWYQANKEKIKARYKKKKEVNKENE